MLQEYKIQLQNNILQLAQIPELKVKYDNLTNKYNTDINDLQIKYQTANLEIEKYKTTNIDKAEDNGVKRKTQSKEILQLQNKIKHLNKQITDQKIEKHNCSRVIMMFLIFFLIYNFFINCRSMIQKQKS